ncbi:WD40-repeat-containing domain protein [Blastocladiella britannica]|nr:WD40-repeat-containing domain protein [Blastocladiella britannica]
MYGGGYSHLTGPNLSGAPGPAPPNLAMATPTPQTAAPRFDAVTLPLDVRDVKFATDVSSSLQCPICLGVCTDPVITHACHHSYCASCIAQSLEIDPYCPLCRRRVVPGDLHPNLALASLISELPALCPYRALGCPAIVRLDVLEGHVRNCGFAPAKCSMAPFGCAFVGGAADVAQHEAADCVFAKLRAYLDATEQRIAALEATVALQATEITRLDCAIAAAAITRTVPATEARSDGAASPTSVLDAPAPTTGPPVETFPHGDIQCRRTIREHNCGITSLAYHEGTIFSGGHDGSIKIFNAETGVLQRTLAEHRETVWSLAVDPHTPRLFSASKDATIKVWDLRRQRTGSSVSSRSGATDGQTFSPAAPPAATTGMAAAATLTAHEGKIYALALNAGASRLYSGSGDCTVRVWDISASVGQVTGDAMSTPLQSFTGHTQGVNSLALSSSSSTTDAMVATTMWTASNDKSVKQWDTATATCTRTWALPAEVLDVAIDDDPSTGSGLLFASTYDATIAVFDPRVAAATGPVTTLTGHNWEVWQLKVTDGVLFSGSFDHTIRRWDPRTFECTATLRGHRGFVHAMAVGNRSLITGCADRTVKIWS